MDAVFLSRASIYEGDYDCIFRTPQNEMIATLHYHDFYEIVVYLGNAGIFKIGGNEYLLRRGDIALINIFEPHTLIANKNVFYERFSISIDPNLLLSFNTTKSNLLDIFSKKSCNYPIFHVKEKQFEKYLDVLNLFKSHHLTHGKDIFEKALLHQLTAYLFDDCYDGIHFDNTESLHVALIAQIVEFINTHLSEDLSLERLAEEVNYSTYYICRIFKKITDCTLNNYIVEKRIEKATHFLKGNDPIGKVAESVGFNNYSYFYKTFKKTIGISPVEYREKVHDGK